MSGILHIEKPRIEICEDERSVRLCIGLKINQESSYDAWYKFDREYEQYLCTDRCDGLVVNLLLYAMEHQLDIVSDVPMSERLHYQLTEYLIPCIAKYVDTTVHNFVDGYWPIKLNIPLTNETYESENAVGASLSGGVDSFYTLLRHLEREDKAYNITHLTFFNAGQSGEYGGDVARERYLSRIEWIRGVADELGLPMLCVDTNINEFLHERHEPSHTFRTLAIPLLMQKLFSKYLFSSGFPFFHFAFSDLDPAEYDVLNMSCLQTENTSFWSSGGETSRLGKEEFISRHPITYKYLNVCVREDTNCSRCEKCTRTMLGLYLLDKLDLYKDVFDTNYFYNHKEDIFYQAYRKQNDHDWDELYRELVDKGLVTEDFIKRYEYVPLNVRIKRILWKMPLLCRVYRAMKSIVRK